ncbi:hypothetical protein MACH16_12540 [Marinomonas pontica]|uniref:Uncharacterized protein n=1 Tax=Marinomonas pontica TaxID=264739 RepID=A0ABN6WKE9_9GAMM|nr:hypothetical protein MACH16_12540 [Marinomonas pontica]
MSFGLEVMVRSALSHIGDLIAVSLMDKGVIKNFRDPKKPTIKQYKICESYKSVVDYIEQGSPSNELQALIQEFI